MVPRVLWLARVLQSSSVTAGGRRAEPEEQGRQMVLLFRNEALQLYTGGEGAIPVLSPLPIHRDCTQVSGFCRGGQGYMKGSDVGQCKGRHWW